MKRIIGIILSLFCVFLVVGCGNNKYIEEAKESLFDNPATEIDHYFSNQISFADTNTSIENKLFIRDKIGFAEVKSVTDGDTAVFHLQGGEKDSYSTPGKEYSYLTVRFLCIDTPESTSAIDPWGKKASNYVKSILENAKGIILDATDIDSQYKAGSRLDSNGTRWLALIWYVMNEEDKNDLSKYRLLQLDVIEECYSRYTGSDFSNRFVYQANSSTEQKLFTRYENQFGSLKLGDVMLEAELRMSETKLRRLGDSLDDGYDYSTTPREISVKEAYENFEEFSTKGTFVALTGVIVRFVGSNFYMADAEGYGIYVYMGINGNSIEGEKKSQFMVGDTINIRGRLCEYGGQAQLSGVVFSKETFKKITDEDKKIPLPEPIKVTGNETSEQLQALIGKLCYMEDFSIASIGNTSKDLSYSLTTNFEVSDLKEAGAQYYKIQIRINGTLTPGYDYEYVKANKNNITKVTGIMSIYQEMDLRETNNFPSYQIVCGNALKDQPAELVFINE